MTGAAKKPGQVPPLWAGGSRTTADAERFRMQARRRAAIVRAAREAAMRRAKTARRSP